MACDSCPQFVDADGNLIEVTTDANGNEVIMICAECVEACTIIQQPEAFEGDPGTAIPSDMGGESGGPAVWQVSDGPLGPWMILIEAPTVIDAANTNQYYRFCCGDQMTTCSDSALLSSPPCRVTAQPQDQFGDPGTAIPLNMGGETTLPAQWQTSGSAAGPWTNVGGPPTVIDAANKDQFYRFCCVEDLNVCSDAAQITTPPCRVTIDPQAITGPIGTAIPLNMGGETTLPAQWQQSTTGAGGPWTLIAGPPTEITAGNDGTHFRFCCIDDSNVCSSAALVTAT